MSLALICGCTTSTNMKAHRRIGIAVAVVGCTMLGAAGAWMFSAITEDAPIVARQALHTSPRATPDWPAPPASRVAPGDDAFVVAAEASVDAVVHIQTASVVADQSNPWLSMLGMATGRVAQGSGSGVIVEEDGLIVTNHHVIEGAREIWVNTSDGSTHSARLVGSDPSTDLAVLDIDTDLPLASMDFGNSDDVRVGEWVLAVGNPLNLTSTVTAGIVSAKGRNLRLLESNASKDMFPIESFLQTDAAVNPGNSGGALVNMRGELIGINTAIASRTGSYAGYSFAIPSSIVAKVTRDLMEFGRVQRAYLGIQVASSANRVEVASTLPEGGAAAAGLRVGDHIVAVDGIRVTNFPSLQEQLSKHRPGDRVNLTLERKSQSLELNVTLTDRAGTTALSERRLKRLATEPTPQPKPVANTTDLEKAWGVTLEKVPQDLLESLNLRGGARVANMGPGSWRQQGLKPGFIVLRVDGHPVMATEDVFKAARMAMEANQDGMLIEGMYANGQRAYAGVAVPEGRAHPRN